MKSIFELLCDDWKTMLQALIMILALVTLSFSTVQSISKDIKYTQLSKTSHISDLSEGQYIIKRAKEIIIENQYGRNVGFILSSPCLVNLYVESAPNNSVTLKFVISESREQILKRAGL